MENRPLCQSNNLVSIEVVVCVMTSEENSYRRQLPKRTKVFSQSVVQVQNKLLY